MQTRNSIQFPKSLRDLYSHPNFTPFGSSSDDWINDPDRMDRCDAAAESGSEGSTHAEIIQDWRDFLQTLESEALRSCQWHDRVTAEIERRIESINAEIDACEEWHEKNGSLHSEIG